MSRRSLRSQRGAGAPSLEAPETGGPAGGVRSTCVARSRSVGAAPPWSRSDRRPARAAGRRLFEGYRSESHGVRVALGPPGCAQMRALDSRHWCFGAADAARLRPATRCERSRRIPALDGQPAAGGRTAGAAPVRPDARRLEASGGQRAADGGRRGTGRDRHRNRWPRGMHSARERTASVASRVGRLVDRTFGPSLRRGRGKGVEERGHQAHGRRHPRTGSEHHHQRP